MMNNRVLELLQNPENIQSEDLQILKKEINSFPYVQNIRALHLYGVHLYDKENYQKELSTTAAYTTDKKILYQLINGKVQPQIPQETAEEEKITAVEVPAEKQEIPAAENSTVEKRKALTSHDYEGVSKTLMTPKPEIKHIEINGERNRILFEGEENFLEDENQEIIDLEATLESGVIVTCKHPKADAPKTEEALEPSSLPHTVSEFPDMAEAHAEPEITTNKNPSEKTGGEVSGSDVDVEVIHTQDENLSEAIEETATDRSVMDVLLSEKDLYESSDNVEEQNKETVEINLNPETIIDEEKITSEKVREKVNDRSELSFHGTDSFLPEIKIQSDASGETAASKPAAKSTNKHEDEMRRLIEQVERKMREKQASETHEEVSEDASTDKISFADTQDFQITAEDIPVESEAEKTAETAEEVPESESVQEESAEEINISASWKPMSFETHSPDSVIGKSTGERKSQTQETPAVSRHAFPNEKPLEEEEKIQKTETQETAADTLNVQTEKTESIETETVLENLDQNAEFSENKEIIQHSETQEISGNNKTGEEISLLNTPFLSFGTSSFPNIREELQKELQKKETIEQATKADAADSNVPGFINTWQSWLKIGREPEAEPSKVEIKNKVIESFIEKNPKISQLKDEVSFTVKEKTGDISHLMTETLANLYIEQKLYTKAIAAFQILGKKFPDRKAYFEDRIQDVKDNRSKN